MSRVLIVEDDITLRTIVTRQLAKLGVETDSAANGVQALQRVRECRYQLIIMDLHMPEMDGFDALAAIRDHEQIMGLPPVPIVALSGAGESERALQAGFDAYFEKPAFRKDFAEMLNTWIITSQEP